MAARIGRPAVPDGSPSSLERYSLPCRYAQQLWVASATDTASTNASASVALPMGAACAMKRLCLISSSWLAGGARVSSIAAILVVGGGAVRRRNVRGHQPALVARVSEAHPGVQGL